MDLPAPDLAEPNLPDQIRAHAARDPDKVAFYDLSSGRSLTYSQLAHLTPRPIETLHAGNSLCFIRAFLSGLLASSGFLVMSDRVAPAEAAALSARCKSREIGPAIILPTSGSTALPKLVVRTHASLSRMAAALVRRIGFTPADTVLATVPLAHSYGLEHGLLAPLYAGSTVLLCPSADRENLTAALTHHPTIAPLVPPVVEALLHIPCPSLKTVYSAGGVLPPTIAAAFFEKTKLKVGQVYGSTEIGSVTYRPGDAADAGGVGEPLDGVKIEFRDGEVFIKSPWMFTGYLDESADLTEGFFPTGDLGELSGRSLIPTGRKKLLIDTGGGKVKPLEVEAVLLEHSAIAECVVLPVAQTPTSFRLRAVIILRHGATATPDDLRTHVRLKLAGHKVPRIIEFRDSLPKSPAGKILRSQMEP